MFEPEIEGVFPLMFAVCPEVDDHVYLDVLALENESERVEDIIYDFYNKSSIPDQLRGLFRRSPFHVSWHVDPNGLEYRVVVIDNRHAASVVQSLYQIKAQSNQN